MWEREVAAAQLDMSPAVPSAGAEVDGGGMLGAPNGQCGGPVRGG